MRSPIIVKRSPLDWAELTNQQAPTRSWLDDEWLGRNYPTLMPGVGGTGKTLLAQIWMSSLSLGASLFGSPVPPVTTLMLACEDDHDELWRRQERIAQYLDVSLDAFAGRFYLQSRVGLDNTLLTAEFGKPLLTPLLEELREQAEDLKAGAVVLDNVAQMFGGNENDRHHVTMFMNAITGALPGRAILLLAHPSRQAGSEFSGSSAWENAVRARLYLGTKLPDQKEDVDDAPSDVRYLCRRKSNYSSKDYRRFTYKDGVLVPDAIEVSGGLVDNLRQQRCQSLVLAGLKKLRDMGTRATDGASSPQFLPRLLIEYKLADGQSKKDLADAMRHCLLNGQIKRGVVGQYANRTPMEGLIVN